MNTPPVIGRLLLAAAAAAPCTQASADQPQTWPGHIVKLVVPFPAGSLTDRVGRVFAQNLGARLKQPVIVENRPGAGATIGADYVAKSSADGYTLLLGTNASHAVNVAFMKLGYDPVKSFEPIGLMAAVPSVLAVRPDFPAKNMAELLALAKAQPGRFTYASQGVGTTGHLGMEMLSSMADIRVLHVPGSGPTQALQDTVAGHVDMLIETVASTAPLIAGGRLRGLAVTGPERVPAMPDLPTLSESGVRGYEMQLWMALYAPAGTPKAIVDRLSTELTAILADPAVRDPLVKDGVSVIPSSGQKLAAFQLAEMEKWGKLIRQLNLKLN